MSNTDQNISHTTGKHDKTMSPAGFPVHGTGGILADDRDTALGAGQRMTEDMGVSMKQISKAAEVYASLSRRTTPGIIALACTPLAAAENLQMVSNAWGNWLTRMMNTNLQYSQNALRSRTISEVAEAHALFIEESLASLNHRRSCMLDAVGKAAEAALSGDRRTKEQTASG